MHDRVAIAEGKWATSHGAVAAVMWLLYDTCIHFDVEVECIWRRPTSWVKFAYSFVRYIPLLHLGGVLTLTADRDYPSSGCRGWIIDQLVVIEVLTLVVEIILVVRVYALYNRNKLVLALLSLAFVAEVSIMLMALVLVIPKQTFTPDCLVAGSPKIYIAYWLSSLIFETLLFVLTLVKFFQSAKREYGSNSILFVFVRDGTWAYAMIFLAMLLNTLLYQLVDTPLAGMGYFWAQSVMSFAGSHVLLNIRRLSQPTSKPANTLSTMQFSTVAGETNASSGNETTVLDETSMEMNGIITEERRSVEWRV